MITVVIGGSEDGRIRGFEISGHSGYAENGKDIICAAISILGQTTIASIIELTDLKVEYEIDEGKASLKCRVYLLEARDNKDHIKASAILDSFVIGCRNTAGSYGKKYIKIRNTII